MSARSEGAFKGGGSTYMEKQLYITIAVCLWEIYKIYSLSDFNFNFNFKQIKQLKHNNINTKAHNNINYYTIIIM